MKPNLDLNVDAPDKVALVLRAAAQAFAESEVELQAAWGEPSAGRVWRELAKIMDRAADSAERACAKWV